MTHGFKIGDRVRNGQSKATIVGLVSDDALSVVYDDPIYDGEPETEIAVYFRRIEDDAR